MCVRKHLDPLTISPDLSLEIRNKHMGTSLGVQWLRLHALNAGFPGLIPGHGTRSCVLQLRPGAAK